MFTARDIGGSDECVEYPRRLALDKSVSDKSPLLIEQANLAQYQALTTSVIMATLGRKEVVGKV